MVDLTKIGGSYASPTLNANAAKFPERKSINPVSKRPSVIADSTTNPNPTQINPDTNTPNTSNNPNASTSSPWSFKACVAVAAEWGLACLGFKIDPGGLADDARRKAYKLPAQKPGVGKDPQTGLDKVS
jgi:hypothetical protein